MPSAPAFSQEIFCPAGGHSPSGCLFSFAFQESVTLSTTSGTASMTRSTVVAGGGTPATASRSLPDDQKGHRLQLGAGPRRRRRRSPPRRLLLGGKLRAPGPRRWTAGHRDQGDALRMDGVPTRLASAMASCAHGRPSAAERMLLSCCSMFRPPFLAFGRSRPFSKRTAGPSSRSAPQPQGCPSFRDRATRPQAGGPLRSARTRPAVPIWKDSSSAPQGPQGALAVRSGGPPPGRQRPPELQHQLSTRSLRRNCPATSRARGSVPK